MVICLKKSEIIKGNVLAKDEVINIKLVAFIDHIENRGK